MLLSSSSAPSRSAVVLLALVFCCSMLPVSVSATCGPWVPVNLTTIPKGLSTDKYDVVYLVAPLMECTEGAVLRWANAFHGGLAFRNQRTNYQVTVNFDASPSFTGAIVPQVNTLPNGTVVLTWENTGAIFLYSAPINYTYWETYAKTVGTVSGDVFNSFMFNYIANANTTFHYYNIWSVFQSFPGTNWVPNNECFSFVWQCWKELARLGQPIDADTLPQSFVALYSDEMPPKVDLTNQAEMKAMLSWYENLLTDLEKKGYLGYVEALWDLLWDRVFYVRDNNYYYKVHLSWPFMNVHYVDVAVPKSVTDTCGGMC